MSRTILRTAGFVLREGAVSFLLACFALLSGGQAGTLEKPTGPLGSEPPQAAVSPGASGPMAVATNAAVTEAKRYPFYGNAPEEMQPGKDPFYKYWETRLPFRGPAHDHSDSAPTTSRNIGLISPPSYRPDAHRGAMTRMGVELAVEEANASLHPGELPFGLVRREDLPQWGTAADIVVDFADRGLLGFLGTIGGEAAHVALRVALKTEIVMVNTSDPDPTLTETQSPWLIRVFPDDRQRGYLLAKVAVLERHYSRIVVFRTDTRAGRVGVQPFVEAVERLGSPVAEELRFAPGTRRFDPQVAALKRADPEAVVFWGDAEEIGPAAAQIRAAGIKAAFLAYDRVVEPEYVKTAGAASEGTVAACFFDLRRTDPAWVGFVSRFEKRHGRPPDVYAAYGYDGARLLLEGIQRAGTDRVKIRDALARVDEYEGVSGRIRLDGRWDNIAPAVLAECRGGRWEYRPAP